jgi:hypothetical protein
MGMIQGFPESKISASLSFLKEGFRKLFFFPGSFGSSDVSCRDWSAFFLRPSTPLPVSRSPEMIRSCAIVWYYAAEHDNTTLATGGRKNQGVVMGATAHVGSSEVIPSAHMMTVNMNMVSSATPIMLMTHPERIISFMLIYPLP